MILACCDRKPGDNIFPEDKYFSVIKKHITNPAPYDLALKFSVEQYYYAKPFGLHKAWLYLSKEKWAQLKKDCPEINLVFPDNEINPIKNVSAHSKRFVS